MKHSNEQYNVMLAEKCQYEDKLRLRLANERALALKHQQEQYEERITAMQKESSDVKSQVRRCRCCNSSWSHLRLKILPSFAVKR